MVNIDDYKQDFKITRVSSNVDSLIEQTLDNKLIPLIGDNISDIEVLVPDIIRDVFDKLDRPVLIVCDDNIEYANKALLKMLSITDASKMLNERFLKFVSQDDWDFIAENIGDVLTNSGAIELRMLNANYKVIKMSFDTMYIEDNQHFCFALIGKAVENKISSSAVLYDEIIGLPKFSLYEYSVQNALDYENYKNPSLKRNKIAVCGIAIKNYTALKNDGQLEYIMQRMAEKLLLSLNKVYTVATGTKYQFWILMPDMESDVEIEQELNHIQNILNQPISNNNAHYDISVAMGVSVYPNSAQSAKKIISQAEMAIRQALKDKQSSIVYFGE